MYVMACLVAALLFSGCFAGRQGNGGKKSPKKENRGSDRGRRN